MKHLAKLLIVLLFAFFSCSQQGEEAWEGKEPPLKPNTHIFGVSLSQESTETFAELGINEVAVYAYLKDSLVFGKSLPLNNGNLKVELPLGEKLQTFCIANAGQMIETDSLSKVMVKMNTDMKNEVYLSDIVDFVSDNSVSNLSIELKRLVGQAVFQPKETTEVLNEVTHFDQLNLTFTNVGVAYKIKSGECIQQDVNIKVGQSQGFSANIYSLPTSKADSRTSIDVVYLKNDVEINRTNSPLDTSIAFEPSKRSIVYMPILDDNYLENSWLRTRSLKTFQNLKLPFTIEESEF